MKKYLSTIALLLFLMTGTAVAETESTSATNASLTPSTLQEKREAVKEAKNAWQEKQSEIRGDMQEKRKELTSTISENRAALEAQIKEKRDAFKAEVDKIKKERVSVRKSFVETRFTETIKNLSATQTRIEAKITALKAGGKDMSEAQTQLDESTSSLAKATALLDTLKAATVSDTNDATVTKPREIAKQIEVLLKETREHLRGAITAIKAALGESDDTATENGSTATTTN